MVPKASSLSVKFNVDEDGLARLLVGTNTFETLRSPGAGEGECRAEFSLKPSFNIILCEVTGEKGPNDGAVSKGGKCRVEYAVAQHVPACLSNNYHDISQLSKFDDRLTIFK